MCDRMAVVYLLCWSPWTRRQGALFNDGISGLFSALATSLPLTTFAQNNGVISLTNVASRMSGYACAAWLIFLGIIGKIGAFIVSIPNCVLGGMTTFLFANVLSSGIKVSDETSHHAIQLPRIRMHATLLPFFTVRPCVLTFCVPLSVLSCRLSLARAHSTAAPVSSSVARWLWVWVWSW